MHKAIVLGGGIAGLSLGYRLKKLYNRPGSVIILEKSERAGGWVRSIRKNGFLCELGPRSIRTAGAGVSALQLIEELGLQDEVIPCSPSSHVRHLYFKNSLQPIPTNPFMWPFSSVMRGVIPALLREPFKRKGDRDDESIEEFAARRFSQAAADRLFDPLTLGIYAGDIKKLSVRSCFPKMWELEKTWGSLLFGALRSKKQKIKYSPFVEKMRQHSLFSFRDGMETLTDTLAKKLKEELHLQSEATSIHCTENGVEVELTSGEVVQGEHLYLTLPPFALGKLLPELNPLCQQIPCESVTVVNVGYSQSVLKREGFGYLVPTTEKEKVLGVVWDSSVFPEQMSSPQQTSLTVMMKGCSQKESEGTALEALKRHLGITQKPDLIYCSFAEKAIPQFNVGYSALLKKLKCSLPSRLTIFGSGYNGVAVSHLIEQSLQIMPPKHKLKIDQR